MSSKQLTIALLVMIVLAALWASGKMERIIQALSGKVGKK